MLGITLKDIKFLKELQHEMLTQDNVGQAAPRFWAVAGTVKEYGYETGWQDGGSIKIDCETIIEDIEEIYEYLLEHHSSIPYKLEDDVISYYDSDEEEWVELRELDDICEFLQEHGEDEAELIGYKEVSKVFENTMFLTNKSCKEHIESNYYHYPEDAHSYAMTAWRSPEVEKLWSILERINWDEVENLIK